MPMKNLIPMVKNQIILPIFFTPLHSNEIFVIIFIFWRARNSENRSEIIFIMKGFFSIKKVLF